MRLGAPSLPSTALVALALLCPTLGAAHPLDMATLRVSPAPDGLVDVRLDASLGAAGELDVRPTPPCVEIQRVDIGAPPTVRIRAAWDCGAAGVEAASGRLEGAEARGLDAVLLVGDANPRSEVLHGEAWSAAAPARVSYVRAGVEHIASGIDHLLFVALLLVLAAGPRGLLTTVTAFTVGHSVTLAAVTLGAPAPAAAPVEALIAGSVLVTALEAARPADDRGAIGRKPALAALLFGLLHGLGFAGALGAAGLPEGARGAALLGFNVGVEVGQLAFVALCVAVGRLTRRDLRRPLVYAAGSVAVALLLLRITELGVTPALR